MEAPLDVVRRMKTLFPLGALYAASKQHADGRKRWQTHKEKNAKLSIGICVRESHV